MSLLVCVLFVLCNPKTAYVMCISDWSSDVCSSDLGAVGGADRVQASSLDALQAGQAVRADAVPRPLACGHVAVDIADEGHPKVVEVGARDLYGLAAVAPARSVHQFDGQVVGVDQQPVAVAGFARDPYEIGRPTSGLQ